MTVPASMLGTLTASIGMEPKCSGLRARRTRHKAHVRATPAAIPTGIANRHHPRASFLTRRITCLGVAPMQRIKPKNSVRWETLLFRLLAIIMMPEKRTRTNRTPAPA